MLIIMSDFLVCAYSCGFMLKKYFEFLGIMFLMINLHSYVLCYIVFRRVVLSILMLS